MIFNVISWIAVCILSISYWFQVYKIHVHKEVRDISLPFNILLGLGSTVLAFTAYYEHSLIFLIKQVLTVIPAAVIVWQIFYHKEDRWHDSHDQMCLNCKEEQELSWKYCPFCGNGGNS